MREAEGDQILRRERGQGNILFFFPVQLTTSRIGNLTRLYDVAESLVRHISTRKRTFDDGGGQLDRRRARGVLTRTFLREKLISYHGPLSFYERQQGAANG